MFILTKKDGLEPCPFCGGSEIQVCHIHRNLRKQPNRMKLNADGSLTTRYYVVEAEGNCRICHARSPHICLYLPDDERGEELFHERDSTPPQLVDAIIEMWNFRYPKDGTFRRVEFRPAVKGSEADD